MKNKLKEEMLKEIFIQTGGREENIKIADVCAEIAVKAISSNTMLAVSLPSDDEIETLLKMEIDASDQIKKYSPKEIDLVRAGFRTGAKSIRDEINERGNDR